MLFLETNRRPGSQGYHKFPVLLDNIQKLWRKRTIEDIKLGETSTALEQRVATLEQQLEHSTGELKKLITIVAKLHDKFRGAQASPVIAHMSPLPFRK